MKVLSKASIRTHDLTAVGRKSASPWPGHDKGTGGTFTVAPLSEAELGARGRNSTASHSASLSGVRTALPGASGAPILPAGQRHTPLPVNDRPPHPNPVRDGAAASKETV